MTHSCVFQKLTFTLYSWVALVATKRYKWLSKGQLRMPDLDSSKALYKEVYLATPMYEGESQKHSFIKLNFVNITFPQNP